LYIGKWGEGGRGGSYINVYAKLCRTFALGKYVLRVAVFWNSSQFRIQTSGGEFLD
jgi:hypothetical protein